MSFSYILIFHSIYIIKSMLYNFYKHTTGFKNIACGKLMIYYRIVLKILSTVQSLLFSMEKCYVRIFKSIDVLLQLFQNLQLLTVSVSPILSPSCALSTGLEIWEKNPLSIYIPVQMDGESIWIPALGPAGPALGCRGYGRSGG